ncbi:lipocalin [Afipia sp. Root123D2]|uniref:YeeE/YedE family protein n=1 Tax=Afipia sp. Root123D2 TaxID=1736436 RepID=UPI0006FDAA5A|nr:YeeE/YedE family protein [Afipia sp. Root123D2]KQW18299.1 lipocalin [Afipia sp. Root123D2]
MQDMSAWMPAIGGFAIGAMAGFAVRRARLCTFGAIEDALMGGDSRRMRIFGLALGIAILGTQALVLARFLDPQLTTFTPPALPLISIMIGSLMFGVGMAMVGTCGFGTLVRLGTGDLRSLVVVLVLGAVAYATLRGVLADFRIGVLENFAVAMPENVGSDMASLSSHALGLDVRAALAAIAGATLCWLALGDPRLRRTPRLLSAGIILGVLIVGGWIVTTTLADEFAGPVRPQSLTFVSTIGKAIFAGILNVASFADFGVGSVFGVVAGSCLAAWISDELRWEAFDDDHEMRRHLTGAALMGAGGILAGGCTIGQGLSAGSMLSLSWPFAVGGMVLGARLGIAILVDGSTRHMIQRGWASLRSRNRPQD